MKDKLTVFTKGLLDFMFFAGIITTVSVPFIIRFYGRYNTYFANNILELSLIFIASGIFAVLIIYELRNMFKSVLHDDCFIMDNVYSLRRMGTYSFFIAAITCCRLFLYLTPVQAVSEYQCHDYSKQQSRLCFQKEYSLFASDTLL